MEATGLTENTDYAPTEEPQYTQTETSKEVSSVPKNSAAINDNGTTSKLVTATVLEQPILPAADFSASKTSGNPPLTVTFTDKSTGSPTAWKWSFGDGSDLVTEYNPTHTYSTAGTYTVKETVSNAAGKDTEIKTNYITVTSPVDNVAG